MEKHEVQLLFAEAKSNTALCKDLGNLGMFGFWENKYYHLEEMIKAEYAELLAQIPWWAWDLHCLKLYRRRAWSCEKDDMRKGLFEEIANAHRDSIRADVDSILEYIHDEDLEGKL